MTSPEKRKWQAFSWCVIALVTSTWISIRVLYQGEAFRDGYVSPWILGAAVGFACAGGFLFQRRWARPIGLILLLLLLGSVAYGLFSAGFAWWRLVVLAILAWFIRDLWRTRIVPAVEEDEPFLSLVLLFREPIYLEPGMLAELASIAWRTKVEVATDDDADELVGGEDARSLLIGESPHFVCSHWPGLFTIHNFDQPYFDDLDEAVDALREMRIRSAVEQHKAWVAVDVLHWFGEDGEKGKEDAYRLIAGLLAELADDNCLAVMEPAEGRIFVYDPETEEKLRSENPLEALHDWYYPPVLAIEADDPDMQAAVQLARTRWPEFVAAFETRNEDESHEDDAPFLVKAPFTDGDNVEYMWVRVTGIENEIIYGILENTPANIEEICEGSRVRIRMENLNDWMCVIDDQPAGAFTLAVLAKKTQDHPTDEG